MSEVFNSKDNEPSKDIDDKTENGAGNQLGKEAEEKIKESDEISSGRSLTYGSPASATVLSVREEAKTQFLRNVLI